MPSDPRALLDKIEALPLELIGEVEDYIDFIASRAQDRTLVRAAMTASTASLAASWENPEDDVYDDH